MSACYLPKCLRSLVFFLSDSYNDSRAVTRRVHPLPEPRAAPVRSEITPLTAICFDSPTDRTAVSGTADTGSIPVRSAKKKTDRMKCTSNIGQKFSAWRCIFYAQIQS